MHKQKRLEAPGFLRDKWEEWGIAWEARLVKNWDAQWHWREHGNEKVNHKLLPLLKTQAADHCSFCDAFPVSPPSNETIEHFRPKKSFPLDAWKWENLFFCCDFCQSHKGAAWEDPLIPPDEDGYQFSDYFFPDYTTGKLEILPEAGTEAYRRAEATRRIYGLNEEGHCQRRRDEFERRCALPDWDIDRFAYRDYLEPA